MKIERVKLKATKPLLPYWVPRIIKKVEYHIRVDIFKQKRYLIDKWKIEPSD
jgi:DNA polymerase elongation subunit (family B)